MQLLTDFSLEKTSLKNAISRYASLLNRFGIPVQATNSRFSQLAASNSVSFKHIDFLNMNSQILEIWLEQGKEIPELKSENHAKMFLRSMKWKTAGNVDEILKDSDIVEIYDAEGIQCFRNLNFFKISSYAIEDILTNEWWNLYERNTFITRQIGNSVTDLFKNNITVPIAVDPMPHWVREIWSSEKISAKVKHGLLIPVQNEQGKNVALISSLAILDIQKGQQQNLTVVSN